METRPYFAYGSNMSSEQMSVRCPDAVKVGLAKLVDYEFMINKRGVAGVIKKQGASVIGILWTISTQDKATLDRCEGADRPDGPYYLEEIAVNTENGSVVALVYIAKNTCLGSPREGYLERIVNAAVDHGIDQGYVDFLEASRTAHERQASPQVEDCSVSPYKLFEKFAPAIRDLTAQEFRDPSSGLIQKMKLASEANLEVCYAPLDYCNPKARIVIVGITPGLTQMVNSLKEAQLQLSAGADSGAALMAAQRIGAFSGTMRVNLIRLLDHIGLNDWLEIKSCDALFGEAAELVHWTSVLRNPVFKNGKNYNGTPKLTSHSLLKEQLDTYFVADIQKMPDAVFVPLGVKVAEALYFLADQKIISKDRILDGLPHPSAANAERIAYFLGRKAKARLSRKTNADDIDREKSDLIKKIKGLAKNDTAQNSSCQSEKLLKNATDILIDAIEVHGLPSEVGARGRTSEYIKYALNTDQTPIIESSEGLKGWIVISNEDEQNLSSLESIQCVIKAFVENSTSGECLRCHDKDGEEYFLDLSAVEPHTESHDFEILIDESEFTDIFFKTTGNVAESVEDLDLTNFCSDHCKEVDWETYFTLGYSVAWLTFMDGFQIGFTVKDGVIVVIDQSA